MTEQDKVKIAESIRDIITKNYKQHPDEYKNVELPSRDDIKLYIDQLRSEPSNDYEFKVKTAEEIVAKVKKGGLIVNE